MTARIFNPYTYTNLLTDEVTLLALIVIIFVWFNRMSYLHCM